MPNRLPVVLSTTALLVTVFGATPLGHAASRAIHAVPPFAKTASYAKFAGNASKLNGRRSTLSGAPGTIPVVGRNGKLPASIGAVGLQGPAGATGPAGPAGPPGKAGASGSADTSELLGRTITITASKTIQGAQTPGGKAFYDYALCPTGYEATGGGAWTDEGNAGPVGPSSFPEVLTRISAPTDGSGKLIPDGQGGPARGWGTSLIVGTQRTIHWSVVCAKQGA